MTGEVDHFSWIFRLIWNLYGYSTILLPIGIIVYMVKHKHCLPSFSNLTIVRIIVYGKDVNSIAGSGDDVESLLINEKKEIDEKPLMESDGGGNGGTGGQSRRQKLILFLVCFMGLHCSYLIWGVYQEKIMTTEYLLSINSSQFLNQINDPHFSNFKGDTIRFHDSQFLVLTARVFALAFSSVAFIYTSTKRPNNQIGSSKRFVIAPLHEFFYSSLSNILSSWCQYEALKYVNFPTQVLSKACKIPSVMFMSSLVSNKKYDTFEYVASFLISVGMVIFLHGNHNTGHNHHHLSPTPSTITKDSNIDSLSDQSVNSSGRLFNGLIVLALYLMFDSFTSNWEEKIFHKYRISSWQMMVALNLCSIILTLTSLTEQGNLVPALITVTSSNQLSRDVILLAFSSTVGQFFVFYTISNFGALIFTMIMTLRQIFAILLSFIIYHHSISLESVLGIIIVFAAIISIRFVKINKVKK